MASIFAFSLSFPSFSWSIFSLALKPDGYRTTCAALSASAVQALKAALSLTIVILSGIRLARSARQMESKDPCTLCDGKGPERYSHDMRALREIPEADRQSRSNRGPSTA
jgi:hypothetical protein